MFGVLLFIFFFFLLLKWYSRRENTPVDIDISKNSEYYMKEFPEICSPDLTGDTEKPSVIINIYNTHNHLHVYPDSTTPAGSQPHLH